MSTHAFFCDDNSRPVTVEVRPIKGHEPKIVVSLSVPGAVIDLHLDDLAAGSRLYERLGNALQAVQQERIEAEIEWVMLGDAPPPGGIVGIQPGNPTMDAHGPRRRVLANTNGPRAEPQANAEARHVTR